MTNGSFSTLEKLLDSTIVTAKSMSLFEHSPRPVDERWEYDELLKPFETDLYTQLQPVSKLIGLKAFFVFALDASSKLGKWCSDRVWHYALSEKETSKLLGRYENSDAYRKLENAQEKEEAIAIIRQAKDTVVGHLFQQTLQGTSEHLSSKVLLLYQKLSSFYEENENTRCIVFVEQRLTAQILADAFTNLKIPNLRSGVLVGVSGNSIGGQVETWKQHENTMDLFRAGIVNCQLTLCWPHNDANPGQAYSQQVWPRRDLTFQSAISSSGLTCTERSSNTCKVEGVRG